MPSGKVEWIRLRPGKKVDMQVVEAADIDIEQGLVGDRHAGGAGHRRQITLFQMEHLGVVAALLNREVGPELTRRNIGVSGINLQSLKDKQFRIGDVTLRYTDPCPPCGRMNETLGEGGEDAMVGHGGIMACAVEGGSIKVGDAVEVVTLS